MNSSLPLTKENLKHLNNRPQRNNEILERFIEYRPQSVPPTTNSKNDVVVASPRLLPFPYHNDSLFLPTAEQIQYQLQSSDSLSTSRAESLSTFLPDYSSALASRPHSTANIITSNYSISMNSGVQYNHERRSLPARLEHQLKIKRFYRPSSIDSSSIASSAVKPEPIKMNMNKKPWILRRILQLFHRNKKNTNQNGDPPVWYCQYSKNPASRFDKFYNYDPIAIIS